jgi:hypothetical protein
VTTPAPAVAHTVDEEERSALDEILGGNRGLVDASIPPITFVTVNTTVGFHPALYAALGAGAALFLFRLVRRERLRHAVFGFGAVAIAVAFAARTGEARDFFLPGILLNIGYAVAFTISALVKRPALGLGLAKLEGHADDWYTDDRVRRYFSLATWLWASLFATRAIVQTTFYLLDKPGWLAAVKLLLGWPVFLASLAPTQSLLRKARVVRPRSVPAE